MEWEAGIQSICHRGGWKIQLQEIKLNKSEAVSKNNLYSIENEINVLQYNQIIGAAHTLINFAKSVNTIKIKVGR